MPNYDTNFRQLSLDMIETEEFQAIPEKYQLFVLKLALTRGTKLPGLYEHSPGYLATRFKMSRRAVLATLRALKKLGVVRWDASRDLIWAPIVLRSTARIGSENWQVSCRNVLQTYRDWDQWRYASMDVSAEMSRRGHIWEKYPPVHLRSLDLRSKNREEKEREPPPITAGVLPPGEPHAAPRQNGWLGDPSGAEICAELLPVHHPSSFAIPPDGPWRAPPDHPAYQGLFPWAEHVWTLAQLESVMSRHVPWQMSPPVLRQARELLRIPIHLRDLDRVLVAMENAGRQPNMGLALSWVRAARERDTAKSNARYFVRVDGALSPMELILQDVEAQAIKQNPSSFGKAKKNEP